MGQASGKAGSAKVKADGTTTLNAPQRMLLGAYDTKLKEEASAQRAKDMSAAEAAAQARTQTLYTAKAQHYTEPMPTSSGDTSGPARTEAEQVSGATTTRRRARFRGGDGSISI